MSPSIQQWTKWNLWKTALKIFIWFTLDYCVANIDKTFFGRPYRLNGTKIRLDASLMAMWRGKLYVVIVRLMSNCLWSRWKLQRGVCLVSLLSYCPVIQKTQILKKTQKKKKQEHSWIIVSTSLAQRWRKSIISYATTESQL